MEGYLNDKRQKIRINSKLSSYQDLIGFNCWSVAWFIDGLSCLKFGWNNDINDITPYSSSHNLEKVKNTKHNKFDIVTK